MWMHHDQLLAQGQGGDLYTPACTSAALLAGGVILIN